MVETRYARSSDGSPEGERELKGLDGTWPVFSVTGS